MLNVPGIAKKNFPNAGRHRQHHDALINVGLTFSVVAREKEERQEYRLHDAQKDENGKTVQLIRHRIRKIGANR